MLLVAELMKGHEALSPQKGRINIIIIIILLLVLNLMS
jgi:hypothetical protein